MSYFRTLSESRIFISLGLLLLWLTLLAPECNAGSVEYGNSEHHSENYSAHHANTLAAEISHPDNGVHDCCTDLSAGVDQLPFALIASTIEKTQFDVDNSLVGNGRDLPRQYSLAAYPLSWSRYFYINSPGLPLYLSTRRLRV